MYILSNSCLYLSSGSYQKLDSVAVFVVAKAFKMVKILVTIIYNSLLGIIGDILAIKVGYTEEIG